MNLTKEEIQAMMNNAAKTAISEHAKSEETKAAEEALQIQAGLKFIGVDVDKDGAKALLEADEADRIKAMKTITTKRFSTLGSGGAPDEGPVEQFNHYMKYHDPVPAFEAGLGMELSDDQEGQKAVLGATVATGAVAIPPLYMKDVDAYLAEESIMRKLGARGVKTNANSFIFNYTEAKMAVYDINNAEDDTAATEEDPAIKAKECQLYDYDKMVRVSNKFVANTTGPNLTKFIIDELNEMRAETENSILCTGTNVREPQGIFDGGTSALTAASATAIAATEITNLYYSLPGVLRRKKEVAFVTSDSAEKLLRALRDTSNWTFLPNPTGGPGEVDWDTLLGRLMYTSGYVPDVAASVKSIAIANFAKGYVYGESEQAGVVVSKERYFEKKQTAYLGFFSFGAAVKNANAIQYITQAAA